MSDRKAVFLDRDGVLNLAVYRDGKSYPPADAAAMTLAPGAAAAVAALRAAGYLCLCVTNQPDIARGNRSWENVGAMNARVKDELGLDAVYTCPHDNADRCNCRKPKPGMLLTAAAEWDIDLTQSWLVGDRPSDIAAGQAAACRAILIASAGTDAAGADHVCPDLAAAAKIILGE
jgi:D-glycero-D-manno-heptose 1,7-bisphosphate phosphatase